MTEGLRNCGAGAVSQNAMAIRSGFVLGIGWAALACACGPTSFPVASPVLPLRSVRLYETGVGYFERSGVLGTSDGVVLPIPAGNLDDALKTLVVLGPGGKSRVQGIEFGSSISRGMARVLAGLPPEGDTPLGLRQLLAGLKGAGVEVREHAASHTGRLVDVVEPNDEAPGTAAAGSEGDATKKEAQPLMLLVLDDSGALVRISAADVESVRPLDASYATRLGSALDALSTRRARSERMIRVLAQGPITLGYVTETPVWRATYRLVFDRTDGSGVLQGWALLHNDTDEDWRGVRVQLANGRPDSFLFPLAAPRYARRPLVTPEDQLATVPQLMGTTVDAIWGDQVGDAFGSGGLGASGVGEGGGGRGDGIGLGEFGSIGHGRASGSSSLLDVGNLAGIAPAPGAEAGALFVYQMPEPLDLRAHGSALVPFAQERVDAQPIAWIDSPGSRARAAVRFVNSTHQTLPAGTIAFFADGGFAGESALERLKPGERSFLTYGQDLDIELNSPNTRSTEEAKRLVWDGSRSELEEHYLRRSDVTFVIENRSGSARRVVFVTALDKNATMTGSDAVDFDQTTSRPLALFVVQARMRVERRVHSVEGLERRTPWGKLTAATMADLAVAPSLPSSDRVAATEAASSLKLKEQALASIAQAKTNEAQVQKDVERLRENMKALAGEGRGGGNPFAARVLAAEDSLATLRAKVEALEAEAKSRSDAAMASLAKLVR